MQRAIIIGGICTLSYYFTLFDNGEVLDRQFAQLQTQLIEQGEKVKESEAALKKLEQIRASVDLLNQQLHRVSIQLPTEVKGAEILKTVDTLAKSTGVRIKITEPKSPIREDIVEKIPLHVRLQGTYSELTMFLYYISIMERMTRVSSFSLTNLFQEEKSKGGTLILEGDIVSYRYVSKGIPSTKNGLNGEVRAQ